jgi:3-phosphoshikimate 1-carboxyvinyltransferase
MASFGIKPQHASDWSHFVVDGGERTVPARTPSARRFRRQLFLGSGGDHRGEVTVERLTKDSLQGDVRIVDCLAKMGCSLEYHADEITVSGRAARGIDVDMNAISDTVQTLAVVALFADGPTTIRNVGHIRHKETDRIGDLARELRKFGAAVDELPDGLRIIPPAILHGATVETYNDHRMAIASPWRASASRASRSSIPAARRRRTPGISTTWPDSAGRIRPLPACTTSRHLPTPGRPERIAG